MFPKSLQLAAVLGLATFAVAQDGRRVEVQAAQASARAELRGQLLASPVAPGVSIRSLVDRDPSFPVDALIDSAEQIGGPRWVEKDIVQVRMQLPASRVVERLESIPIEKRDPRLTLADMAKLTSAWKTRSFQATGQAIPVSRIESLVAGVQTPHWQTVPQAARIDAANRARASAVGTIVNHSTSIRIGPNDTLEPLLASGSSEKLTTWASSLPATRVLLRDDRQVEIGLYVDKEGLGEQLKAAMTSDVLSQSEKVQALEAGIRALPTIVVGRAAVQIPDEVRAGAPIALRGMPAWASDPVNAEATSAPAESKLRTARNGERSAKVALRGVIDQLKLEGDLTLKQAAAQDPRVIAAIDRAIDRARVYQVDYNADGSAIVRVTLDPNELLDELTSSR